MITRVSVLEFESETFPSEVESLVLNLMKTASLQYSQAHLSHFWGPKHQI